MLLVGCIANAAELPSVAATLRAIFQPQIAPRVALAPDGRHLAYALRRSTDAGIAWSIAIVELGSNRRVELPVRPLERIYGGLSERVLNQPRPALNISYLQWASADLVVFYDGWSIRTVDSEGRNGRRVADQYDLGVVVGHQVDGGIYPRSIQVENLLPGNPGLLIVSAAGRAVGVNSATTYQLDLVTRKWKSLGEFAEGGSFVRDQQGRPRLNQDPGTVMGRGGVFADQFGVGYMYRDGLARESLHPFFGIRHWDKFDDLIGKQAGLSFSYRPSMVYQPPALPLAFDRDPSVLYYAANTNRDTYAIHALDLATKQSRLVLADPVVDLVEAARGPVGRPANLVFDREGNLAGIRVNAMKPRTEWLDPEVAAAQQKINDRLPGYNTEITQWDRGDRRYLVSVSSPKDPGGYQVVDVADPGKPVWVLPRTQETSIPFNPSTDFAFDSPAGVRLTGTITRPLASRVTPPPAVIYCHSLPGRATGGFNRITQALTTLGFVVIEVNYRGSTGLGTALRDGLRENPDAPIDDILATLAWVKTRYPIDPNRVALYGDDLGAYFALRTLELHPELFRAGVGIRTPESINAWISAGGSVLNPRKLLLGTDAARTSSLSLKQHRADLIRPVLLVSGSVPENLATKALGSALKSKLVQPDVLYSTGYRNPDDPSQADVELYLRIGAFLNDAFYKYEASIGDLKVLK